MNAGAIREPGMLSINMYLITNRAILPLRSVVVFNTCCVHKLHTTGRSLDHSSLEHSFIAQEQVEVSLLCAIGAMECTNFARETTHFFLRKRKKSPIRA
jgi:hypothetical protein